MQNAPQEVSAKEIAVKLLEALSLGSFHSLDLDKQAEIFGLNGHPDYKPSFGIAENATDEEREAAHKAYDAKYPKEGIYVPRDKFLGDRYNYTVSMLKGMVNGTIKVGDSVLGKELLEINNIMELELHGQWSQMEHKLIHVTLDHLSNIKSLIQQGAEHGLFTSGHPLEPEKGKWTGRS